jgi:hypothetical protein
MGYVRRNNRIPCGAQDLDAINELNAVAHGGADNLSSIENVRYLLAISDPGFEVSGTYDYFQSQ